MKSSSSTGTIDGSGNLKITGTVTNSGTINQTNVIIESGGTLNSAGDKITATIENKSNLNLTSGNNSNTITGTTGTTTFGKANTTVSMVNSAQITQSLIKILGGATVTNQSGNILTATNSSGIVIERNGVLIIEDAANINANITDNGTLKIAGVLASSNTISGSGNITINDDFTNKGSISTTVLELKGDITGDGTLTLNGDNDFYLTPEYTIEQSSLTITGGTTTANIDQLNVNSITNNSRLNLKKEGSYDKSITGSGTLNIQDNIETTSSIVQGTLIVDNEKTLTNSNTITLNTALQNHGTIENNGTLLINKTTSNGGQISGTGTISIAGGQNFTTNANLLGANQTLDNLGTLILTGGSEDSRLTFDIAGFSDNSKTTTGGIIQFGNGTASSYILNNENLEQKQIVISRNANVENTDGISLTSLSQNISNAGTLTVKADDIKTNITNSSTGIVNLKGGVLNKVISDKGTVNVNSDLVNKSRIETVNLGLNANIDGVVNDAGESPIIQLTGTNNDLTSSSNVIKNNIIKNTGTLSVKANQINEATAVQNSGSLYITEGILSIDIDKVGTTGGTTYFGSSTSDIVLTNNATITQAVIDVLSNTTLNNTGELKASTNIKVEGILNTKANLLASNTLNTGRINLSDGKIEHNITGAGVLNIENATENIATISQKELIIQDENTFTNSGSGNITVTTTLSNEGTIANNAKLTLQGGSSTGTRNQTGSIDGTGDLTISGHYNNDGSINQKTITISNNYSLTTEVDKIVAQEKITVGGSLYLRAESEAKNNINNVILGSGNGTTYIDSDLRLLSEGKSIASKITINGEHKLNALAGNVIGNVTNAEGELILEGGTLTASISGGGKTKINGDVVANNSIENLIEISAGKNLEINAENVGNTVTTNANSTLKLTGGTSIDSNAQLNNSVGGSGLTEIAGHVSIGSDATISTGVLISNGTLKANADSIKGNVVNNSTLSITGGTISKTITATSETSGTINVLSNDVILSNTITNQNINIQSGSLVLNTNDNFVNNTDSIEITGGILNMQDDSKTINSISLYDFTATNSNSDSGIKFDTDFSFGEGSDTDTINVSHAATGNLNLKSINVKSHFDGDAGATRTIKLFTGDGDLKNLSLGTTSTALGQYIYEFKQGENSGELIVKKLNGKTLEEIIQSTDVVADTYSIAEGDYTLTDDMGILTRSSSETSRELTINGNRHALIANGNQGVTINSGDTLDLVNIQGFKNFTDTAVTNSGNLNVDGVKFENNGIDIDNNGTLTFKNNASILSGGISGKGTTTFDVSMNVSGKNISQDIINISKNIELTANAGDLSADSYILNDGLLKLSSGTNSSVIKNSTGAVGAKLEIIGAVINSNNIEQNILISQGSLTSSADNIKGDIENNITDGLILTSGTLNKTVSGLENTVIDTTATVEMGVNGSINQDITIKNGILKTTLSQISNTIKNQGTLAITGSGTLEKNIEGSGLVDILGNIENSTNLSNVNIQKDGSLTTDASKLTGNISNSGDINLSGTLNKTITGNGKVNINKTLNLTSGAAINGTLNLANSTLNLQDNSYDNYAIGKLENDGNLKLDINTLNDGSSDSITLTNAAENSIILTISDLAIKTNDDDFILNLDILRGETTNISLKLSDELKNQYNIIGEITQKQILEGLEAEVTFDDEVKTKVYDVQTNTTMDIVDNKLQLTKTTTSNFTGQEAVGDTLALINQSKDFDTKTMTSNVSNQIYELGADLGLTKNTLTVKGVKDDSSTTSINMNQYKGFELKDDNSVLNLQNLAFTNTNNQDGGLIDVQNSNAKVNFSNVEIAESSANLIYNDGTITLSGDNTINTNVIGSGVATVQDGTTSVNNIIQSSINIQTGANLEITGGVIESNIQGLGNTLINTDTIVKSDVQSNILVNDDTTLKIDQGAKVAAAPQIDLSEGSTLDIQGTAPISLNNINVTAGKSANLKMDWGDTIGTDNILGTLTVSSIDLTSTAGDDTYKIASGTNLGNISFEGVNIISNTTSANSIRYSSSTGDLTSMVNNLVKAVADNKTGDSAIYSMLKDEDAGDGGIGVMDGGKLIIQGNSHTIINNGIQVGDGTNNADLTLIDTNFEVTEKALEVKDNSTVTIQAESDDITINGDIVSSSATNTVTFKGTKTINFNGKFDPAKAVVRGVTVNRGGEDDGIDWTVTSGSLNYSQDSYLDRSTNTINMNGGTLNTVNGVATDFALGGFTLSADSNFYADVDLANRKMDNFQNTSVTYNGGTLHVAGLSLVSDAIAAKTSVPFTPASWVGQGYVDYTGSAQLTALAPIYKYNVSYNDTTGNFDFARFATGGWRDYNPSVLAAPVAA